MLKNQMIAFLPAWDWAGAPSPLCSRPPVVSLANLQAQNLVGPSDWSLPPGCGASIALRRVGGWGQVGKHCPPGLGTAPEDRPSPGCPWLPSGAASSLGTLPKATLASGTQALPPALFVY